MPWFALPLVVLVLIGRTGHWFTAVAAAVVIALPGMFGLWQPTMETLALMLVAVAISVLIGVPLGVAAGLNRRFYAFLRPVLDAMQTVPSTAFLVPAVLFFGIGPVPAAVATVVYAMAPVVRLTALGIRQVPTETVEAGHVFGSTRRQLLFKVQLPQAVPSIMTGVNQTINMALGIIVIAALVGAGGLGQEALETLRLRSPGRGLVVGLAIVAVAVMLDRVSRSFIHRRRGAGGRRRRQHAVAHRRRRRCVVDRHRPAGSGGPSSRPTGGSPGPTGSTMPWPGCATTGGRRRSGSTSSSSATSTCASRRGCKQSVAWPVLIVGAALAGYAVRGWRLALFCAPRRHGDRARRAVGAALETLVMVCIAVTLAMLIAVPIGRARRPAAAVRRRRSARCSTPSRRSRR